jgi:endonuclease/exonuclease/phosphatase family metal-dependent hydrolase
VWHRIARTLPLTCIAWVAACDGSSPTAEGPAVQQRDTVTLMTYNIFHDAVAASQGILAWPERRDAVVGTILSGAPDVLGIQEAELWQVEWLLGQLPEYAAVARGPFVSPDIGDAETVAILYRQDRFQLQESGHFWYSDAPDSPGSEGGDAFGGMNRPRMATWTRLRRAGAPTAKGFYVFNTHFAANSAANDGGLARFKSAELLATRIAARSYADEHFFLIGDLNSRADEWPVRYLLGSRCESSATCADPAPQPDFRLIDAWASQHPGDTGTGTRCNASTGADGERVDYVLVWDPASGGAPEVTESDVVQWGAGCPSDHRPVLATVVLPLDPS